MTIPGASDRALDRSRVRIPADTERPDRLLAGLTARQLGILTSAALVLWSGYAATRTVLPLPAFAAVAVPAAGGAVMLAAGRIAGQPTDRLAVAAWWHLRRPRRLVPAPDGLPPLPAWVGVTPGPVPAPLRLPLAGVRADGTVDLGADGLAVVARASSVTFALRTPAEQQALVAGFGRWLNALAEPVQILLRATPVELTPIGERLLAGAPDLPHPALEAATRAHAVYLEELSLGRTLLHREVLVVFAEPSGDGNADRLARRVEDARAGLAAAGVSITGLDGPAVIGCLLAGLDPAAPRPTGLAGPGQVVTGAVVTGPPQ